LSKGTKKQNGIQKKKKRRLYTWVVTLLSLVLVSVVGLMAWYQMSSYEEGMLDVYANQQDGYVQLVLDQINLNKSRSDKQIIDDILGTLDASNNRYWTFSRGDSLIFVRDVLETNRYKGYTTTTYYHSESAKDFLKQLTTDKVVHDIIQIEEIPYIASGVEFSYQGENYKICLLTNAETVLDYNAYLNAKINLVVLAFVLLQIVVISLIFLALLAEKYRKQLWRETDKNIVLRKKIEQLNEVLERGELYDPECTAFQRGAVPVILKKLEERQAWPFSVYYLRTDHPAKEALRTIKSGKEKVLRVIAGEYEGILFVLGGNGEETASVLHWGTEGIELLGTLHVTEPPAVSLMESYREFIQGIRSDGR